MKPTRAKSRQRIAATFWLLVVAWLCANMRPGMLAAAFDWVSEATQFSHQKRLTLEVAKLLGEAKPVETVAKSERAAKPKPAAPALATALFKKLETPLARETPRIVRVRPRIFFVQEIFDSGIGRAAPPHAPPRA